LGGSLQGLSFAPSLARRGSLSRDASFVHRDSDLEPKHMPLFDPLTLGASATAPSPGYPFRSPRRRSPQLVLVSRASLRALPALLPHAKRRHSAQRCTIPVWVVASLEMLGGRADAEARGHDEKKASCAGQECSEANKRASIRTYTCDTQRAKVSLRQEGQRRGREEETARRWTHSRPQFLKWTSAIERLSHSSMTD